MLSTENRYMSCTRALAIRAYAVQEMTYAMREYAVTRYAPWRCAAQSTVFLIVLLFPTWSSAKELPFGGTDFKQYYTTSKQILSGNNPYDYVQAEVIQRRLGSTGDVQVPYGPPTSLLPFIPFGWLDYPDAVQVQLILNSLMMIFSAFLWGMMLYPVRPYAPLAAIAVVVAWLPCINMVGMGHITSWTLFGFTLWCFCQWKQLPLAAGVALALSIVKPHLALGLVFYACIYGLRNRQWKMLAAFAGTILLMIAATFLIRPSIWSEYLASLPQSNPMQWYNATLDGVGRLNFGDGFRIVSLGVMAMLLGWIALIGWTRDLKSGPLVCALWMVATPYAFNYDFILLIPCIVIVFTTWDRARPLISLFLLTGWILIDVLYIRQKGIWREYQFYVIPWCGLALTMLAEFFASHRAVAGNKNN